MTILRRGLVVGQIGLAILLLAGTAVGGKGNKPNRITRWVYNSLGVLTKNRKYAMRAVANNKQGFVDEMVHRHLDKLALPKAFGDVLREHFGKRFEELYDRRDAMTKQEVQETFESLTRDVLELTKGYLDAAILQSKSGNISWEELRFRFFLQQVPIPMSPALETRVRETLWKRIQDTYVFGESVPQIGDEASLEFGRRIQGLLNQVVEMARVDEGRSQR